MLTSKQRDLIVYIHERMRGGDVAPSQQEMATFLKLKSKSGVNRLINGLEERGYIERLPNRARAIEVRKLPEGYNLHANKPAANSHTPLCCPNCGRPWLS